MEVSWWNRKESKFHIFTNDVEIWLYKELKWTKSYVYLGRFAFSA